MITLDPVNYKNGPKNNWRRTVWNTIHNNVRNVADALVLYLPGAANLDRELALRHGFKPGNLIAIERDAKVADHIRREHQQITICSDLYTVMRAWPDHTRPRAVIADLVTGFDDDAHAILRTWMGFEAFRNSLLILNVMRGRETGEAAKALRAIPAGAAHKHFKLPPTHRSMMIFNALVISTYMLYSPYTIEQTLARPTLAGEWIEKTLESGQFCKLWGWKLLPSYRSGHALYFDSIAIGDRGTAPRGLPGPNRLSEEENAVRRCISAALALRTMRLRGDFQ